MKIRRYYVGVFVEPEAYDLVRRFKRGEKLTMRKTDEGVCVFHGETYIGKVRGKKRPIVGALFSFIREAEAELFNMNEKEGVMLVHVRFNDEPYK